MTELSAPAESTPLKLRCRLYVMMFLQYFIQGSYLPVISEYLKSGLGFDSNAVGMFGAALAVGPLVAPFLVGQIVDRMFATQWVLAACHAAGGIIMIALYKLTGFVPILILGALYSALYVPSMMLTNSLTFYHLADREREFPLVRLWGTIGFVLPAWCIEPFYLSQFEGDERDQARGIVLLSAGLCGLLMALYSLALPHTPPEKKSRDFAPGRVLALLRLRHFGVLVGVSLIVSVAHKYFWVWNAPYLRSLLGQRRHRASGRTKNQLDRSDFGSPGHGRPGAVAQTVRFQADDAPRSSRLYPAIPDPRLGHHDRRGRGRTRRRGLVADRECDRRADLRPPVSWTGAARIVLRMFSGRCVYLRRQSRTAGRPWKHADLLWHVHRRSRVLFRRSRRRLARHGLHHRTRSVGLACRLVVGSRHLGLGDGAVRRLVPVHTG